MVAHVAVEHVVGHEGKTRSGTEKVDKDTCIGLIYGKRPSSSGHAGAEITGMRSSKGFKRFRETVYFNSLCIILVNT